MQSETKSISQMVLIGLLLVSLSSNQVYADHSPTHSRWSIDIMEEDVIIDELQLDSRGAVSFLIIITNENLVSITVDLNYSISFDAEVLGPASVEVSGSSDVEVEITIYGVKVMQLFGGEEGDLEITGTVTSRQGLPISIPGDSDSAEAIVKVPIIHNLVLEIIESDYSVSAGSVEILELSLSNMGNVEDEASEVIASTSCKSINVENQVRDLVGKKINKLDQIFATVSLEFSEDYYPENCIIEVIAVSRGSDGMQTTQDSANLIVKLPEIKEMADDEGFSPRRALSGPTIWMGVLVFIFTSLIGSRESMGVK